MNSLFEKLEQFNIKLYWFVKDRRNKIIRYSKIGLYSLEIFIKIIGWCLITFLVYNTVISISATPLFFKLLLLTVCFDIAIEYYNGFINNLHELRKLIKNEPF